MQSREIQMHIGKSEGEKNIVQSPDNSKASKIDFTTGYRERAWVQNCVGIGQSIAVLEPISPGPMLLLQYDIDRLLSLIPVSADMSIEAREFNRRFNADFDHIEMFDIAILSVENNFTGDYWCEISRRKLPEKLARKIEQFSNRGGHRDLRFRAI